MKLLIKTRMHLVFTDMGRRQGRKPQLAILPEIWDATGSADPRSSHHHDPLELLLPDALRDILQGLLLS